MGGSESIGTASGVLLNNKDILSVVLPHLDVVSLVEKNTVCSLWRDCCDGAIKTKWEGSKKRAILDRKELGSVVKNYMTGDREDAETIAEEFGYPIGTWDVSNIRDFSGLFWDYAKFNEDISSWNVSNVTNMRSMFYLAKSFNQNLNDWDVSNVKDISYMFYRASNFNGDLSKWNVSNVTIARHLFCCTEAFQGKGLSCWDLSNVKDMSFMFFRAYKFDGDLSNWNVSNVANMSHMFWGAQAFQGDLSRWDVSNVSCAKMMFQGASNFNIDFCSPNFDPSRQFRLME